MDDAYRCRLFWLARVEIALKNTKKGLQDFFETSMSGQEADTTRLASSARDLFQSISHLCDECDIDKGQLTFLEGAQTPEPLEITDVMTTNIMLDVPIDSKTVVRELNRALGLSIRVFCTIGDHDVDEILRKVRRSSPREGHEADSGGEIGDSDDDLDRKSADDRPGAPENDD